jgi:predicted transcriptional regulator
MSIDRHLHPPPGIPMPPRSDIRLSLDVSPELNEALTQLAAKLNTTKSDVLRKAIALMEVAVRAKEERKMFGIAAPGQALETEIVGL